MATPSEERMRQVFKQADRNGNGTLALNECLTAMKQLGHVMDDRGIRRVMEVMDKDDSGVISYEGVYKLLLFSAIHFIKVFLY